MEDSNTDELDLSPEELAFLFDNDLYAEEDYGGKASDFAQGVSPSMGQEPSFWARDRPPGAGVPPMRSSQRPSPQPSQRPSQRPPASQRGAGGMLSAPSHRIAGGGGGGAGGTEAFRIDVPPAQPPLQPTAMVEMAESSAFRQGPPMTHSYLVQKEISLPTDAKDGFTPAAQGEIPVVLVVKPRSLFSFMVTAPPEHKKIWTVSNRHDPGQDQANGLLSWRFFNTRISHIVSGQAISYDCPVTECPTADNVMITVDVTINFKIVSPADFVFNLGAHRADELLSGAVEEGTRLVVRQAPVAAAKTLQGNQAGKLLDLLKKKTENCGISFDAVKVTSVRLPKSMEAALQATTEMNAAKHTLSRQHDYKRQQVENEANREKQAIIRRNQQQIVARQGDKQQAEFTATNNLLRMREEARIKVAQAEEQVEVMKFSAMAEKDRARKHAETTRATELNTAKEGAMQIRLDAERELKTGVLDSVEELAQSERAAREIQLKAEVETKLAAQIRLQREHELALAQRKVLGQLAEKAHYNLIGEAGDIMLKSMMEGDFNEDDFAKLRV